MSHIVSIHTKVHDPAAVAATCRRLKLVEPAQGTAQLFSGEATGLIVRFPGWEYPAIIDPLTGIVHYDNFNGIWGEQSQLDHFLQIYAVEKARIEARRRGHQVSEVQLEDGSIKLQITEAS